MPYKSWNVVRAGEEYRNKDGDTKRRWEPVGTLLFNEDKNSFSLKLNMFDGWFNCFENDYKKASDRPVSEETEKPKW